MSQCWLCPPSCPWCRTSEDWQSRAGPGDPKPDGHQALLWSVNPSGSLPHACIRNKGEYSSLSSPQQCCWKFSAPGLPRSQALGLWDTSRATSNKTSPATCCRCVQYLCHEDSTSGHLTDSGIGFRGKVILIWGKESRESK